MNLIGKNVVIYGAGASGLAAYALVRERGGRAIIFDDNPAAQHATSSCGVFENADVIVLSPGVESGNKYILDAKLENKTVIGELELASSVCRAEQIAVTGTNGKTTTVMLIDHILRAAHMSSRAVGNIGTPYSTIADKLDAMETVVVEASSFQLESVQTFSPDVAVLLNITPDHLDRHKTMQRYVAAKSNIFLKQAECDRIVYNADDKYIQPLVPYMNAKRHPFSLHRPVTDGAYVSSGFVVYDGQPVIELEDLSFKGRELENVLAAVAVTVTKGISIYTIASALTSFKKPEYRRNMTASIDGISIFNDSKATNVYAALSAAESMDGGTVMILGGAKLSENFDELFAALPSKVLAAVATGDNAEDIRASARAANFKNLEVACDVAEAIDVAFELAADTGATNLLFSPASKSYDRYSSYAERGKAFDNALTERLKNEKQK